MKLINLLNEIITEANNNNIFDEVYVMPSNANINYWDKNKKSYNRFIIKKPIFFNVIKNEYKNRYWIFVFKVINDGKTYSIYSNISPLSTITKVKDLNLFSDGEISNFILSYEWTDDELKRIISNKIISSKLTDMNNKKVNEKIKELNRKEIKYLDKNQSLRKYFFPKKGKGLATAVMAKDKSETALRNVGFRQTQIGSGSIKKGNEGELKYSTLDNLTSSLGIYQQVNQNVLLTIKNLINLTNGEFKNSKSAYSITIEVIDGKNLFYKVKNSKMLYWGKSNTLSKFYVPKDIENNNLIDLNPEDENMIKNHGYDPNEYKLYEYKLVIRK